MNDTLKWNTRFLWLAHEIGMWSKDPSTKVGSVIINDIGQIVGSGYNGFPRGVLDTENRLTDRPTKYSFTVHAELNAVIMAGERARGAVLYCTLFPCHECAKAIIQAGIKKVVARSPSPEEVQRWGQSFETARTMFYEASVEVPEVEFP